MHIDGDDRALEEIASQCDSEAPAFDAARELLAQFPVADFLAKDAESDGSLCALIAVLDLSRAVSHATTKKR